MDSRYQRAKGQTDKRKMTIITTRRISQIFFFLLFIWFCIVASLGTSWSGTFTIQLPAATAASALLRFA